MSKVDQKGFAQVLVLLIILSVVLVIFLFISSKINVTKKFSDNVQGVLIAKGGDDNEDEDSNSGSGSSGSTSNSIKTPSPAKTPEPNEDEDDDENDNDDEDRSSPSTSPSSIQRSSGSNSIKSPKPTSSPNIKIQKEGNKSESEYEFANGEKIKTKVEDDGRSRIDIYSGGIKLRYEVRDGRVIIKAEAEDGSEVEGDEIFKIVDRMDKDDIRVSTAGGKLSISRGNFAASSNFPLSIDLSTNQLIASTSAGIKILTILPDQAVKNLLAANVISQLPATQSASLTSIADAITLGELNGLPVYTIKGVKSQNLLGFIPVNTPITAIVSAENGTLISEEQSLFSQIIDLLSP